MNCSSAVRQNTQKRINYFFDIISSDVVDKVEGDTKLQLGPTDSCKIPTSLEHLSARNFHFAPNFPQN